MASCSLVACSCTCKCLLFTYKYLYQICSKGGSPSVYCRSTCKLMDTFCIQVINAYMKLLTKHFNPRNCTKVKVHITSTFFYTKLRSSGYAGVERWLKNLNLSRLRLFLVPVHLGLHWTLAAVDFKKKVTYM